MADEYEYPYVGELRIFSAPVVPKGWAGCDGQTLPINGNEPLFSLIGTTYGGNGQTTFCLPDLRGRVPISNGDVFTLGELGGQEGHTLTQAEMAHHQHMLQGNDAVAAGNVPSSSTRLSNNEPGNLYGAPNNVVAMNAESIGVTGGSMPHENRQPYLVLNFCICIAGQFPPRAQEAGA